MKAYEIWSEGYRCNGESSGAIFHDIYVAHNFDEAVSKFFENKIHAKYRGTSTEGHPTYWGCRLFDNETDARKSFG